MKNNHKNSGIVLIVLGGVMLWEQFVPSDFWPGFSPVGMPLFEFFDSPFVWRAILCALGVLWLVDAVRKYHHTQMCFALILTLASLHNLLHLGWIPFWPFVPAVALVVTGVLLLYRITKAENIQPATSCGAQYPYLGTTQEAGFDEPDCPQDNLPGN